MKKTITCLICLSCLVGVIGNASLAQKPDHIVAYYPFSGNAMDSCSNHYNGRVSSPALVPDRFNHPNSAYFFNGYSDYIDLGDVMDQYFVGASVFSVSVWVNPTDLYELKHILCKSSTFTCNENQRQWALRIKHGHVNAIINYDISNQNYEVVECINTIPLNTWTHIVMIYDGTINGSASNKVSFYINGVKQSTYLKTSIGTPSSIKDGSSHLGIGNNLTSQGNNCGPNVFSGIIDDLYIFNKKLSDNEIKYLFDPVEPIIITQQPVSQKICRNASVTFSVKAKGDNLHFQWYHNNKLIPQAVNSSYTIQAVQSANDGNYYCQISNSSGLILSNTAYLTVVEPADLPIIGYDTVFENSIYEYKTIQNSNYFYQWQIINGTAIGNTSDFKTSILWGHSGSGRITLSYFDGYCLGDTSLDVLIMSPYFESNFQDIMIYPTLTHTKVYIEIPSSYTGTASLIVSSSQGKVVLSTSFSAMEYIVNLESYGAGIYIFTLKINGRIIQQKIEKY